MIFPVSTAKNLVTFKITPFKTLMNSQFGEYHKVGNTQC